MEFSKSDIQKLFNIKSERLSYENVDGKSTVWKQFARVKVDDAPDCQWLRRDFWEYQRPAHRQKERFHWLAVLWRTEGPS